MISYRRLALLLDNNGGDPQGVVDACCDHLVDARIVFVAGGNGRAYGVRRARIAGLETLEYGPARFASKDAFYRRAMERMQRLQVDLVLTVEYGEPLPAFFIHAFLGRILSIHPSLDAAHLWSDRCGLLSAHDILAAGKAETGATGFIVSPEGGRGQILEREYVPVFSEDQEYDVLQRVRKAEQFLLPRLLADGLAMHGWARN